MERFLTHTGTIAPLRRSGVDTDQIIPARFLKRVTRTGFADGLFAAWRTDPTFVLQLPEHAGATVLVAGPDFGTGSSREHAVWALQDFGFRVVISPRFGDIFRSNAAACGLLALVVDQAVVSELWDAADREPGTTVTVDLGAQRLASQGAGIELDLDIDPYLKWRLMEGLDDVALTLRHEKMITAFEHDRQPWLPTTTLVDAAATPEESSGFSGS